MNRLLRACDSCREGHATVAAFADDELDALGRALSAPTPPLVAIVGGAKVSSKLTILESLADRVDVLVVGVPAAELYKIAPTFRHIDDISTAELRKLLP